VQIQDGHISDLTLNDLHRFLPAASSS